MHTEDTSNELSQTERDDLKAEEYAKPIAHEYCSDVTRSANQIVFKDIKEAVLFGTKYGREESKIEISRLENAIHSLNDLVQNHEKGNTSLIKQILSAREEITALKASLETAVAALEFYGERNNWRSPNYDSETKSEITISDLGCKSFNGENDFADFAIPSGGRRAREALAKIRKA